MRCAVLAEMCDVDSMLHQSFTKAIIIRSRYSVNHIIFLLGHIQQHCLKKCQAAFLFIKNAFAFFIRDHWYYAGLVLDGLNYIETALLCKLNIKCNTFY